MKEGIAMRMLWSLLIVTLGIVAARPIEAAPITVQSFGGVCNGVTDDTAALINWANAATQYSTLALYGNCVLKSPLTFPIVNHVQITGKGSITYAGSSGTVNIITIGSTNNDCSVHDWFISDISIRSTTNMTAGDALRINDMCDSQLINVDVGRLLNGDGMLYNAIHFNGGNTVYYNGGGASAKNVAMIVNGDPTVQFTDFYLNCTTLVQSKIGLEVAGNVGGLNAVCGDILLNNVNIQVDRGVVNVANNQIFLGPNLALDQTTGGANHDLYITDPGGPYSLLFTSGTWIASAANDCIQVAPGVGWTIHMSGGTVYNCGGAGIYLPSSAVKIDISGVLMDYINNYAINNPSATANKCAVTFGSHVTPANISGTVGSSC